LFIVLNRRPQQFALHVYVLRALEEKVILGIHLPKRLLQKSI